MLSDKKEIFLKLNLNIGFLVLSEVFPKELENDFQSAMVNELLVSSHWFYCLTFALMNK